MLRATVRRVHALGDVSVTIDGMYGSESLIRMPCRFNPAPGDRIFVADVAPSVRGHDWVAWAPLTEIGRVTPPEAHEHPPGQIVGLVDWLKQYEAWMGDHQARLDEADKQIAEGKTQIDAARKDLTQAQSDIAAGVREAALERARLDQVETTLDQTARNVTAAGTRIAANEAALAAGQKRLDSAETALQVTGQNLTTLQGMTKRTVDAAAALGGALAVGYETSVLPAGSDGTAATGWTNLTVSTDPTAAAGSGYPGSFYTQTNSMVFSDYVPVVAGDTYLWHVSAKADQPGSNWYVQIWQLDASGASVAPNPYVISRDTMPTVWTDYSGTYTVPATVTQVRMLIYPLHGTGTTTSGTQRVTGMSLRRKVPGDVAVNGGITALAVNAEKVSGALGQFLKVEAASGTFTDSLTGRNARLLGETVAESINITGKLRGRDAILSGTVDVGQLNVTGEMSAKIVRAMDITARRGIFTEGLTAQDATLLGTTVAEKLVVTDAFSARVVNAMTAQTKQLVVTEDAILNRATVVQSLVTPELIASKVDARYLRADNIKTGLLEVFGRFRTAPDGKPQIIIQPSQAAWNSKDLAIWFTPDGGTPGGGDAMMYAVTGGMWMNPAGGGGRSESLWTAQQLNLRGQSRAGVRIMDGLTLQTTAGTVGPAINTPSGQFLNIIGGSGASITTLNGPLNISPWGDMKLTARNGDATVESGNNNEVRLHAGTSGVKFTSKNGNSWSYDITTSTAANLNIDAVDGTIYRVTSSRRYKKYISDYTFDVTRLRDVRLRKWRDRKQAGQDEDLNYYYGAIAEEIYELYPEHVPMIADPTWDGDGPAPMIPDSIAYDRLALGAAVAGWQDTDRRLTEANHLIQSLETRVTQLEGTTHA